MPTQMLTWLFRKLPPPLLAVAVAALGFFFVGDVVVPDALPFVDEAVLALLFSGAIAEVARRRRVRREAEIEAPEVDAG